MWTEHNDISQLPWVALILPCQSFCAHANECKRKWLWQVNKTLKLVSDSYEQLKKRIKQQNYYGFCDICGFAKYCIASIEFVFYVLIFPLSCYCFLFCFAFAFAFWCMRVLIWLVLNLKRTNKRKWSVFKASNLSGD